MSLHPPHLPSPAQTPDNQAMNGVGQLPGSMSGEEGRKTIRDEVETRLGQLSQDLYELEICAGAVVKGQEDRIPEYM
jgi:mediator of RNA polymerase II transcription subunit 10